MFEFILDNISFRGRARRLDYWLFALLGPIILGFVGVLVAMVLGRAGLVIALVLGVLYMVLSLGLHVRRLHDREMSGHWLWVFWAPRSCCRPSGRCRTSSRCRPSAPSWPW